LARSASKGPPDSTEAPRHLGLGLRLTALVVISTLLVGGLVAATSIDRARAALRQEILAANLSTADLAATFAARYVEQAQASARELAGRSTIRQALLDGTEAQLGPGLTRFMEALPVFEPGVTLFDASGSQRVTGVRESQAPDASAADRDWFQQAVATRRPYLGQPVLARSTGRPSAPYAVPGFDEQDELRGVLGVGISLAALSDAITSLQGDPSIRISLIDLRDGGTILAHVNPERILTTTSGLNAAVERLLRGERDTMETPDSADELTLAAFTPVPGLPWGVLVSQPSDVAFAPIQILTRNLLGLLGLILLSTALLGGGRRCRSSAPCDACTTRR
jgi:hypothetical protein